MAERLKKIGPFDVAEDGTLELDGQRYFSTYDEKGLLTQFVQSYHLVDGKIATVQHELGEVTTNG